MIWCPVNAMSIFVGIDMRVKVMVVSSGEVFAKQACLRQDCHGSALTLMNSHIVVVINGICVRDKCSNEKRDGGHYKAIRNRLLYGDSTLVRNINTVQEFPDIFVSYTAGALYRGRWGRDQRSEE